MSLLSFWADKAFEFLLKQKKFSIRDYDRYEKSGVHILPLHYASPIPEVGAWFREDWNREKSFQCIDFNVPGQKALLKELAAFSGECAGLPSFQEISSLGYGPGYGEVEAHVLHAVLRFLKPKNVIEVGSGVSTYFTANALAGNRKENSSKANLICVEPFPSDKLRELSGNDGVELILKKEMVENLSPGFFAALGEGDLLFLDSSHAVRPRGDIVFLYHEVLPALKRGVWIHIHDIPFPYPCIPREHPLFKLSLIWREADILQAFLIHNDRFKIELCESYLHYKHPDWLKSAFDIYDPGKHFPSSLWLRKIL